MHNRNNQRHFKPKSYVIKIVHDEHFSLESKIRDACVARGLLL